ncbi:MAG: hypothetical protein G3M70_08955 [Candidatus Nitronauta litoralis]|uniref:Uncharacterized protein n=1 Tax=Candidatus Nitronauta litoralis TaxID=2705533 RepID=A0A7T0G074_9BACT|nr:MAG: hypothetical protein G3M70_08955 [Candidatus Nitronauta litoralis]
MSSGKEQIQVLLNALRPVDQTLDGLITRMEDRSAAEDFQQLKEFSRAIKIALAEAINGGEGLPMEMGNVTPLIDMAENVADSIEAKDLEGEAIIRSYREAENESATEMEKCIRAAEFIKIVHCN